MRNVVGALNFTTTVAGSGEVTESIVAIAIVALESGGFVAIQRW